MRSTTSSPSDELTPAEKAKARLIFQGKAPGNVCVHCGGLHDLVLNLPRDRQPCPRVKHATFHLDGTLTSVEYWPPAWDQYLDIVRQSDVFDEDEELNVINEAATE